MRQDIKFPFPLNEKFSLILMIHENTGQDPKYYIGQPKLEDGFPAEDLTSTSLLGIDSLYEVNSDGRYSFIYKSISSDATDDKRGLVYFSEVVDSNGVKHVICALKPDDYEPGAVKVMPAFVIHKEDDRLHQLCAFIYNDFRRKKHKPTCDLLSSIASRWSQESYFDLNLQMEQVPEEILFALAVNRLQIEIDELRVASEEVKSCYLYSLGIESSDNQELSYADVYAWCYSQAVINGLILQQMQDTVQYSVMLRDSYNQLEWMIFCAQEEIRRLEIEKQKIESERNRYCTGLLQIYEASGCLIKHVASREEHQLVSATIVADVENHSNEDDEVIVLLATTDCVPGQSPDVGLIDVVGHRIESDSDESPYSELTTIDTAISSSDRSALQTAETAAALCDQDNLDASQTTSTASSYDVSSVSRKDDALQTPATTTVSSSTPKSKAGGKRKKPRKERVSKNQNPNATSNAEYSTDEDFTVPNLTDVHVARRSVACRGFHKKSQAIIYHEKNIEILQGLGVKTLRDTVTAISRKMRVCEDSNLVEVGFDKPFLYVRALRAIYEKIFADDRVPLDEEMVLIKQLFQLLIPKNCTIIDCNPDDCATPVEMVVCFLQQVIGGNSSQVEHSQNYELRKIKSLQICKDFVEIIIAHGFSYSYVEGPAKSGTVKAAPNRLSISPHVMYEFITIIEPIIYDLIAKRKIDQLVTDIMPLFFDKSPTGTSLYSQFELVLWDEVLNSDDQTAYMSVTTIRKLNKILYAYFDLLQQVSDDDQKKMCDGIGNIFAIRDPKQTACAQIMRGCVLNPAICTPGKAIAALELILSLRLCQSEMGYRSHPAWRTNSILRSRLTTDELSGMLFMNLSVEGGDRAIAFQVINVLSHLERHQISLNLQTEFKLTYICLYGAAINLSLIFERNPTGVDNFIRIVLDLIMSLSVFPRYEQDYKEKFQKRLDKFNEYLSQYCPNQIEQLMPKIQLEASRIEKDPRIIELIEFMRNQRNREASGNGAGLLFSGPSTMSAGAQVQQQDISESAETKCVTSPGPNFG